MSLNIKSSNQWKIRLLNKKGHTVNQETLRSYSQFIPAGKSKKNSVLYSRFRSNSSKKKRKLSCMAMVI
jgi:hypothetical protein